MEHLVNHVQSYRAEIKMIIFRYYSFSIEIGHFFQIFYPGRPFCQNWNALVKNEFFFNQKWLFSFETRYFQRKWCNLSSKWHLLNQKLSFFETIITNLNRFYLK